MESPECSFAWHQTELTTRSPVSVVFIFLIIRDWSTSAPRIAALENDWNLSCGASWIILRPSSETSFAVLGLFSDDSTLTILKKWCFSPATNNCHLGRDGAWLFYLLHEHHLHVWKHCKKFSLLLLQSPCFILLVVAKEQRWCITATRWYWGFVCGVGGSRWHRRCNRRRLNGPNRKSAPLHPLRFPPKKSQSCFFLVIKWTDSWVHERVQRFRYWQENKKTNHHCFILTSICDSVKIGKFFWSFLIQKT